MESNYNIDIIKKNIKKFMYFVDKNILLAVTIALVAISLKYGYNLKHQFDDVRSDYMNGLAINLSEKTSKKDLSKLLFTNGYVANKKDATFIADTLVERLNRERFKNLYYLQKRDFGKVPMVVADSLGVLSNKVKKSKELVGLNDSLIPEANMLSSKLDMNNGTGTMMVRIKADSNFSDVVIRVKEHYVQSNTAVSNVIGWVKSDSEGNAVIIGLDTAKGYSVLPIRLGYEYGPSQGVECGNFIRYRFFNKFCEKENVFVFNQMEHRVQMIDNATIKKIKNDGTITVRTPDEFIETFVFWLALVMVGWWILIGVRHYWIKQKNKQLNKLPNRLVALVMFMTVFCVIMMFSIQNPLTEDLRGVDMAIGVLIGLLVAIILQFVDFKKLYEDKYKIGFDPVKSIPELAHSHFSKPFKQQIAEIVNPTKNSHSVVKKVGALLLLIVTFLINVFLWIFKPREQKVFWLSPILNDDNKSAFLKVLVWMLIIPCFLINVVAMVVRWLFLPFKRKVKYLTCLLDKNKNNITKFAVLMLLSVCAIVCIPLFVVDLFYLLILLIKKTPKGTGWLLLALLLTGLLWTPFGSAVGGMRVNLNFGFVFQPSEIAKYLILFFLAAFFAQYASPIEEYSRPGNGKMWNKLKMLGWVIFGLIALMLMYLTLGDMGPGLVIGVTFLFLYSFVKSKVKLENLKENDKWKRIFSCDFSMLVYGVVSFAIFIIVGAIVGNALVGALIWFVAFVFGCLTRKQFLETPFIMNILIFLMIFGGQILPAGTDMAERFEQRTMMCLNTWGDLDIEHAGRNAEAVSNTQVANGLWALATGGFCGQGLGRGNPNLIPAFHTDMILSSIGEQTGWIGLLVVTLIFFFILRTMIVIGFKVGHRFVFYFCAGVAIVTGVQFLIIALGSSGMIPLTGVTVPFLSCGRVSMILNLIAFGIVLSCSNIISEDKSETQKKVENRTVDDYNYPVSIVSWTFVVLAIFTLGVWKYYCCWNRGNTLVHPSFVYNREGTPLIEYNPRIAMLTKEMWAGDIYDRNGVLLATSDKSKIAGREYIKFGLKEKTVDSIARTDCRRYYPFGEHLFFMLGDINSGLYFSYDDNNPIGYMAEAQHLAYLRNYDNVLRDKEGRPVVVYLKDKNLHGDRFVRGIQTDTTIRYVVRDNRELIGLLKSGKNGRKLEKHNKRVREGKFDLRLTLDAKLQTKMQNNLKNYVDEGHGLNNFNLLRISVVVLDAKNGDMLTSANYPLPNYQRLREEDSIARDRGDKYARYSDYYKNNDWKAYTDRDLGTTFQTMPGSTAKVMSAMAGLQKMGKNAAEKKYFIASDEIIESGSAIEPNGYNVTMRDAIVLSSNCYFINLVNDNDLYNNLDSIYETVGARVEGVIPYYYTYTRNDDRHDNFKSIVESMQGKAIDKYLRYKGNRAHRKMDDVEWQWAWGQGTMTASPLNMARVASAVVNDGVMPITQYVIPNNDATAEIRDEKGIRLLSKNSAGVLHDYMKQESANQINRNAVSFPDFVGGKTGTPERVRVDRDIRVYDRKTKSYKMVQNTSNKPNDGWYVFFIDGNGCVNNHPLAVAVRMERGPGSGYAVRLTKSVILKTLYECGYTKNM